MNQQTVLSGSKRDGDNFQWDQVKIDKHKGNYLGNSIMAPTGRWQMGKDLIWYAKDHSQRHDLNDLAKQRNTQKEQIEKEIATIRAKEQALLQNALIHGIGSSSNTISKSIYDNRRKR